MQELLQFKSVKFLHPDKFKAESEVFSHDILFKFFATSKFNVPSKSTLLKLILVI